MQEVGGSIPPGSTTFFPFGMLCLAPPQLVGMAPIISFIRTLRLSNFHCITFRMIRLNVFKLPVAASFLAIVLATGTQVQADLDERTIVLRERGEMSLLNGSFTFKLLKIKGYSVDVRVGGQRRNLKFGEAFSSPEGECSVKFDEISPETRIARFLTDCP